MKPMEDAPLYLGVPRAAAEPMPFATAPTEPVVAVTIIVEETIALRELRTLPPPTLAIRIDDLRGRPIPLRLADLRGDDEHAAAA